MNMDVMKKVEELKIVPVVKLDRAEDARPLEMCIRDRAIRSRRFLRNWHSTN